MDRSGQLHAARPVAGIVLALAGLFAGPADGGAAWAAGYRLIDLGGMPGGSCAYGITTSGFAAGYEIVGPSQPHAVLFTDGQVRDLGTLGGDASLANGVGSDGTVVGWARLADATRHAFIYRAGAMQDLGTLGGDYSIAFAVNHAAVVVGASAVADARNEVPFVWTEATGMQPLPLPEGVGGQALDINDAGEIAGYLTDAFGVLRAFRSDGRTVQPLAELDFPGSKAYAIGSSGILAGYALAGESAPHFHAVLWRGNTIEDLGALHGGHSVAYDVNAAGEAVGFSYDADNTMRAALFVDGTIVDLTQAIPPGTGWELQVATAITDDGVISGMGTRDGVSRAFALVPDGLQSGSWGTPAPVTRLSLRAWPMPMRDAGTLELALVRATHGRVVLYDLAGRRVAELAAGDFPAGRVRIALGADVLARAGSGVFYTRFEGGADVATQRVVIVR